MAEASVVFPTDKYNFEPLNDLKKRIEDELSGMSVEIAAILEQKQAEALRKQREEEERQKQAEATRKIQEAQNIAEQNKIRQEEETKRKLAEAEAERKAREAAEIQQREITNLKAEYSAKLAELGKLPVTQEQLTAKKREIDELIQLHKNNTNETTINLNTKITLVTKIIDFINTNKPKTVADIKNTPEYNIILSDIIFIMESFYNKSPETQAEIIGDIKSDTKNNPIFELIKNLYNEFKANFSAFIENINIDSFSIQNYTVIMNYIRNTINLEENKKKIQNNMSDLYEIIVGTARVAVRCKPKEDDNTSPAISSSIDKNTYTFREYFASLLGIESVNNSNAGGGRIVQTGGYNYNDIFKISTQNSLEITKGCNDQNKTYGPFYSIYPPQYNNYHIYYNMFGLDKFNGQSLNVETITNYDELLRKDKLNDLLKGGRTFDTSNINNKSHELMKKLKNGGSAVIFGYGFSGSGKTYALIEGLDNDAHYDPSILEQFIKDNSSEIKSVEFLELYPLGISHNPHKALLPITGDNADNIKKIVSDNVTVETIKKYADEYGGNLDISNYTDQSIDIYKKIVDIITYQIISTRIKLLERHRIAKLRILSTPNNDKSSRSFLQITIKLNEVNINGKSKTPKLVLFDMPGTENTVRIKTQFINEKILADISKQQETIVPDSNLAIYSSIKVGENVKYIKSKYASNLPQFNRYTKSRNITSNTDDIAKQAQIVFKNFIMQMTSFSAIHVFISYDSIIAEDGLEFALFLNGYDIERPPLEITKKPSEVSIAFISMYNQIQDNATIYFLSEKLFMTIVKDFIKFLLDKDVKDNTPKYFSVTKNKYCKIDNTLSSEDYKNITNIFNVKIDKPRISSVIQKTTFIHFIDDIMTDNTTKSFSHDLYEFDNNFVMKISEELTLTTLISVTDDRPPKINLPILKPVQDTRLYFANPLIKYIYLILNYLYRKSTKDTNANILQSNLKKIDEIKNALPQLFYRSATFFIYKYINFIVNQGRSIVTTLEHLKFFFLSRTGGIKTYNTKNPKKSFNCNTLEKNISAQPKIYYNEPTTIGTITIQERINLGNMEIYGLIDILQELSNAPLLDDCDIENTDNTFTINLLKSKSTSTRDISKQESLLGAIFIMFANYKMFLDKNEIDIKSIVNAQEDLSTLCTAAKDTAEFTDSISSTSINKPRRVTQTSNIDIAQKPNTFAAKYKDLYPASVVVQGGKRKFNLNQLLNNNNHNNQKHKTHKIKRFSSMKNILKNKKLFSTKTKKK